MKKNSGDNCIIAIDPGIGGAIAWIWRSSAGVKSAVTRMPIQQKKSGRNEVDVAGLLELLNNVTPALPHIYGVVEQVTAMPKQGVSSMFSLGDSYGCARTALALYCLRCDSVVAARWKRALGLTKDKGYSLTLARKFFPAERDNLKLKRDEGKAEALLLAKYADEHLFKSGIYTPAL